MVCMAIFNSSVVLVRLQLKFMVLFQHGALDMIVKRVQIWRVSDHSFFSMNPGQFASFCMMLEHREMGVVRPVYTRICGHYAYTFNIMDQLCHMFICYVVSDIPPNSHRMFYRWTFVCQRTSSLPDGRAAPCQKYISGSVLALARKNHSDISPTPPLNFTGVKKCEIWPLFSTRAVSTECSPYRHPKCH